MIKKDNVATEKVLEKTLADKLNKVPGIWCIKLSAQFITGILFNLSDNVFSKTFSVATLSFLIIYTPSCLIINFNLPVTLGSIAQRRIYRLPLF